MNLQNIDEIILAMIAYSIAGVIAFWKLYSDVKVHNEQIRISMIKIESLEKHTNEIDIKIFEDIRKILEELSKVREGFARIEERINKQRGV